MRREKLTIFSLSALWSALTLWLGAWMVFPLLLVGTAGLIWSIWPSAVERTIQGLPDHARAPLSDAMGWIDLAVARLVNAPAPQVEFVDLPPPMSDTSQEARIAIRSATDVKNVNLELLDYRPLGEGPDTATAVVRFLIDEKTGRTHIDMQQDDTRYFKLATCEDGDITLGPLYRSQDIDIRALPVEVKVRVRAEEMESKFQFYTLRLNKDGTMAFEKSILRSS